MPTGHITAANVPKDIFNTLRQRQNGRHFADDIFKGIFLNENEWISINISLKYVPRGPINNIPTLVQVMVGADQATSQYLNQWWLDYRRIYESLGLNQLRSYRTISKLSYWWLSANCGNSSASVLVSLFFSQRQCQSHHYSSKIIPNIQYAKYTALYTSLPTAKISCWNWKLMVLK